MDRSLGLGLEALILLCLLIFLGYKLYRDRRRTHAPMFAEFVFSAGLLFIWVLVVIAEPLLLWQRELAAVSAHYGVFFYYGALNHMLHGRQHRSRARDRVFWSPRSSWSYSQ